MTNKLLSLLDEINEQKVKVRALAEADNLEEAKAEIDKEIEKANDDIKKEIIEIAYVLAEKIINEEIDKSKYDELVHDFMKEKGEKND